MEGHRKSSSRPMHASVISGTPAPQDITPPEAGGRYNRYHYPGEDVYLSREFEYNVGNVDPTTLDKPPTELKPSEMFRQRAAKKTDLEA